MHEGLQEVIQIDIKLEHIYFYAKDIYSHYAFTADILSLYCNIQLDLKKYLVSSTKLCFNNL